jgi:hypothetical protein
MKFCGSAGDAIESFEGWKRFGLPSSRAAKHWKEGRSACELARAWTSSGVLKMPADVIAYLESQPAFMGFHALSGKIELETVLPFVNAGPRCHDLIVVGEARDGSVLVSIEAKADEEFDKPAEIKLRDSLKNPATTFPDRLEWLTTSILGLRSFPEGDLTLNQAIRWLPYQLLSGVAGALIEAEAARVSTVIFLIHEFKTKLTKDLSHLRNAAALNRFLNLLCETNGIPLPGRSIEHEMLGPILFAHAPVARNRQAPPHLPQLPLYIGKIVNSTR